MKKLLFLIAVLALIPLNAKATTLQLSGFETGDSYEANSVAGSFSYDTGTVRTGTYSWRCNPTTSATCRIQLNGFNATSGLQNGTLSTTATYTRFYFRYATKPASNNEIMAQYLGKISLRLNSAGNIEVYDWPGSLIATSSTALAANTWYRIGFTCKNGTSETYELTIDGVSEASGSGFNYAATNCTAVNLGKQSNLNSNTVDFFYDDVLIDSAAIPGAGQIHMLSVTATGSYDQFALGAGTGADWQQLDEIPADDDTSYLVSSNTSGQAVTGAMTDSATLGISGTINSVKAMGVVKRDGASNGTIALRIRSATTDSDLGNFATGAAYQGHAVLKDTDPATSAAWTTSGIDGIEVGEVEKQAAANLTRVTAVYASVDYTPSGGTPTPTPARTPQVYFYED